MTGRWIFILFCTALAITASRAWRRRRQQIRQLKDLARELGLHYVLDDLIGLHERYQNLRMIRRGHSRLAWNVLHGSQACGLVTLFCYRYELGFGARQIPRTWWIGVVETTAGHPSWHADSSPPSGAEPSLKCPPFFITAQQDTILAELKSRNICSWLTNYRPDGSVEVHGPLLAVAVPLDERPETPRELYAQLIEFARKLT